MAGYGVEDKDHIPFYNIDDTIHDWTESGYGFLAGPAYSIPFAIMVLITGTIADFSNRTIMMTISCFLWSGTTFAMAYA